MKVLYSETGVLTIQAENDLERFALSSWQAKARMTQNGDYCQSDLKIDVETPDAPIVRSDLQREHDDG